MSNSRVAPRGEPLRILVVEDREDDTELMMRELRKAGIACTSLRVENEPGLRRALQEFAPDVVLTDHTLPQLTGMDVLGVVRRERSPTPVIIVTEAIDEETAADYIKAGAVDYVVKDRLRRLAPAVRRALALRQALTDAADADAALTRSEVSERKRAVEQLRRTTEFLSHSQAIAHIGSWEWDVAENVVTWSDETYRIFGVAPDAGPMSLERYLALIHPDDRDMVGGAFGRTLATGAAFEIDHRIIRPDAGIRFLYGRGARVTDAAGSPVRLVGAVLDITSRKQAEEALRLANERLRAVIDSSPLAIFSVDARDVVETWNPAGERLFGWSAAEAIGKPLPIVPDDKQAEFQQFRARVLQGESVRGVELVRQKKDGSAIIVNLFAAPLHDGGGRTVGILGVIEDVTSMKALEQQFYQAQKMEAVGRLASGVAHDFNNLLTVILASADFLLETLPSGHPGREDAEQTRKAAMRAADLTRQLLAFSRQQVMAPRVLSLNAVVTDMDKMLRRLIGDDVDLRTVLAADLGPVRADPGQLEQVIANLAVNAGDAMPAGGKLTIETANVALNEDYAAAHAAVVPGAYVMLAVSDTGTGMDAPTQARLFEPFFTTKEKGRGTGLGLASVYGIVKQSGGSIWVYSEPGQGSTFKIYLPRVDAAVEPAGRAPDVAGGLQGSETVLVVDDQEQVRLLMRRILEARGYRVLAAASGPEAIRAAQQHGAPIALLLTDVVMPGMSGREVSLLLTRAHPGMKVLYLSGYTDEAIVHHGVLEPGVAFLQKPFTPEGLARKVREVLDTPPDP